MWTIPMQNKGTLAIFSVCTISVVFKYILHRQIKGSEKSNIFRISSFSLENSMIGSA